MKYLIALVSFVSIASAALAADSAPIEPKEKSDLFNGKDLAGWAFCLKDANVDPKTVFSVKDGVIRIEGKPSGYMRTEKDYTNYKLHVEYRWAAGKGYNSGVLVHMSLPDMVWPKSIECQLMNGNAGDFYVIEGTEFKEHQGPRAQGRRVPKWHESSEKAIGEWNTYEILCKGDMIQVWLNGVLQNQATGCNISSGKILLQSEGGPIEFRNVYIEPVGDVKAQTPPADIFTPASKPAKEKGKGKAEGGAKAGTAAPKAESKTATTQAAVVMYTCPMHPDVISDKPGKCPKCGMNLVEKK